MKDYDFSDYKTFKELFRDLYYRNITIDEAESKQDEFNAVLHVLKNYSPKHDKYVTLKNSLVDNELNFTKGERKLLKGLKTEYFHFIMIEITRNEGSLKKKKKKRRINKI